MKFPEKSLNLLKALGIVNKPLNFALLLRFSIIIDDFDLTKAKEQETTSSDVNQPSYVTNQKVYTRQASDASIKKILVSITESILKIPFIIKLIYRTKPSKGKTNS